MSTNIKLEDIHLDEKYGKEAILPPNDFLSNMHFTKDGLMSDDALASLHKNGLNELKQAREKKWYNYLFASLFSPFNVILLLISLVLIYTDVILASTPSYANIVVILVLVTASTLLEFIQEYRSNKAALKLRNLVATTTTVLRDGKKVSIQIKEVVTGDVVFLSAGDMIPADIRIIEEKDLHVGQSTLTGESEPVKKVSVSSLSSVNDIKDVSDLDTICFMGTNVVSRKC